MDATPFIGLIQNAALLLAMAFLFDLAASRWHAGQSSFWQAPVGLALGTIGVTVMLTPWSFVHGIVFDSRSVLLGISGLFFGSVSTLIAMAMTATFRLYLGGAGVWAGIMVILASGLIGIAWRHFRRRPMAEMSLHELYFFGIAIHLAMLGLLLTLPWATALRVLSDIALPVILIYPPVTALLGALMVNRLRRERVEEELRKSRESVERLAQEMAVIAEIGKVVSSTMDIEEVYERFATEVRKLIPFDRLAVNLHDLDRGIVSTAYSSGEYIPGRQPGDSFPLEGSVSQVLVETRAGMFSHPLSVEEMDKRFPNHSATVQAGMRSLLSVPLISRDKVIASLHFRSKKPDAYTERDLRLAARIGEQIAGAIANSQLYTGLKKTEKELKESEQRYRDLSIIDDLTQLYNSRHFYFQLRIEVDRSNRYGQPLTLLLLDLDNFKHYNDTYGHVEGDQVLQRLGQVVRRSLRETDFAYRYGGEEFTIILPMTTCANGVITAERIRTEFKKEAFSPTPGQDVYVTVSIGLAQYKPQEEMKAFVHRVDQLMYQGKKNGKDRVCYES